MKRSAVAAILSAAALQLQAQRQPPVAAVRQRQLAASGAPPAPPVGAAVVRGRVVTPTGYSVPHAHVRMQGADAAQARIAVADAEGQFEFRQVGPGATRLLAAK